MQEHRFIEVDLFSIHEETYAPVRFHSAFHMHPQCFDALLVGAQTMCFVTYLSYIVIHLLFAVEEGGNELEKFFHRACFAALASKAVFRSKSAFLMAFNTT